MISYGVIKDKSKSSRCQDLTHTITKPTPVLCVVAPPKVAVRKTYLNHPHQPFSPQPIQPLYSMMPGIPANHQQYYANNSTESKLIGSPTQPFRAQPTRTTQTGYQLKKEGMPYPKPNIQTLKSGQRLRIFQEIESTHDEKEQIRKFTTLQSPVQIETLQDAKEQFQFTKKGKTHHMPRDHTYKLIIFSIPSLPPFEI